MNVETETTSLGEELPETEMNMETKSLSDSNFDVDPNWVHADYEDPDDSKSYDSYVQPSSCDEEKTN